MQDLSLFKLPLGFRGRNSVVVMLWWMVQGSLFRYSPHFFYAWRVFLLRIFGAKIGTSCLIRNSVIFTYPWKVSLGNNVWIGDEVVFYSLANISVGNNSVISQKSYLCAADHDYKDISFPIRGNSIEIGNGVWIATDVYLAPGVTVADGAVVGARSSVFSDLPSDMVCFGTPCRPIKSRI